MPGGLKLTDKDKGWDELKQIVLRLSGTPAYCLVGVQGREAAANTQGAPALTISQIASWNEFGNARVPERSFIRACIDEHRPAIQSRATRLGAGVLMQRMTAPQALALLGEYAVGLMKARIAAGIQPANAPSTIKRKRSSKPLIDTGQLRNSITYTIEAT